MKILKNRGFSLIELTILVALITGGASLIPISVSQSTIQSEIANQDDKFGYDPITDKVTVGPDGKYEYSIYPTDEELANGTYGLVQICGAKTLKDIRNQVLSNVPVHANNVVGPGCSLNELVGLLANGVPAQPGIAASVRNAFEARVGDVVIILTHATQSGSGDNTLYLGNSLAVGRIMDVNLTGNPKKIVVQKIDPAGAS